MGSHVFVAQAEPNIWEEKMRALEEIEAFSMQPPSSVVVSNTGQVVDDCINVGADGQTEHANIVSDVTNIRDLRRIIDIADATCESGSPCTAAYRANLHRCS